MSTLTSLISAGGGGTPVNSIVKLWAGGELTYTDESGGVYLKTGNVIVKDESTYPNAYYYEEFSVSNLVHSFSIPEESAPADVVFNNDGTRMYVIGTSGDDVNQYALSTPFDISTATFMFSYDVGPQESTPKGVCFNNDGTKMYVCGTSGDDVNQYALSTPFDVSTATFTQLFSLGGLLNPEGIRFNNDGTLMFILIGSVLYSYTLSTAFDISTAVFKGGFNFILVFKGFCFNSDGTKIYLCNSNIIYEYLLTTAFDEQTCIENSSLTVVGDQLEGVTLNNDDNKIYAISNSTDTVYEYDIISVMGLTVDTGDYDYLKLK